MDKLLIEGGYKLNGSVTASGAKNSALPISGEPVKLQITTSPIRSRPGMKLRGNSSSSMSSNFNSAMMNTIVYVLGIIYLVGVADGQSCSGYDCLKNYIDSLSFIVFTLQSSVFRLFQKA